MNHGMNEKGVYWGNMQQNSRVIDFQDVRRVKQLIVMNIMMVDIPEDIITVSI